MNGDGPTHVSSGFLQKPKLRSKSPRFTLLVNDELHDDAASPVSSASNGPSPTSVSVGITTPLSRSPNRTGRTSYTKNSAIDTKLVQHVTGNCDTTHSLATTKNMKMPDGGNDTSPYSPSTKVFILLGIASTMAGCARVFHLTVAASLGNDINSRLFGAAFVNGMNPVYMSLFAFKGPGFTQTVDNFRTRLAADRKFYLAFTPGIWGAVGLMGGVMVTPMIGASLYFVIMVCSQIFSALACERFGWMPKSSPTTGCSFMSVTGLVFILGGAILSTTDSLIVGTRLHFSNLWLIIFPILSGFANVGISLGNRLLTQLLYTSPRAITVSSTIASLITLVIAVLFTSDDVQFSNLKDNYAWVKIFAGCCGAYVVYVLVNLPAYIGLAAVFCYIILGTLSTSLLTDTIGILGMPVVALSWKRVLGTLLVLVGVVLSRGADRLTTTTSNNKDNVQLKVSNPC